MFDEILKLVKEHMGGNPDIASAIPADRHDEVHNEIAGQLTNGLKTEAGAQGDAGGLLNKLQDSISSGGTLVHLLEGGLVGGLAGKLGLNPVISGAIAAALPGLIQKFVHKANDPNDTSITHDTINQSLSVATDANKKVSLN